jgi:ATP-dependent helicase HrpB
MYEQHALILPLRAALADHRDAVLQAPPGAGKSTLVPLALLAEAWLRGRKILLLEPRRLAARAVAQRMASLLGERVGDTVGYRMRLDTRVSRATRIEVVTEGVLTRMLQSDPALDGIGCVIFDEFHERSLNADLGLALSLDARAMLDAEFRIIVMSATLDGERVGALLNAPVVDVPGRSFPVDIRYAGRGLPPLPGGLERPEQLWLQTLRRTLEEHEGDVLMFLPGAGEIRRVQQALTDTPPPRTQVLPLYGDLSAEDQDRVFDESARRERRIVLATNIAETSVTIPGITVVVDTGLARRSLFDPGSGMIRLELLRISRAAAAQRAGRAGRTAPGVCYRVWSEGAHATLAAHTPAEILETDLAPLMLDLAQWGAREAGRLRWLDVPPAPMQQQARDLLRQLDALDAQGQITATGRAMAQLPLHPRLAHLLLRAAGSGAEALAADIAALLSERDLLRAGSGARDPDLRTRLEALKRGGAPDVDRGALMRVRQTADRLRSQLGLLRNARQANGGATASGATTSGASAPATDMVAADDDATPGELLLAAFPDRIGQRRGGAEGRYLLSGGRGALFRDPTGLARNEFIVVASLDDQEREARIQLAAPLDRESLLRECAARIETRDEIRWDARGGIVVSRRARWLGALLLEESALGNAPAEALVAAMIDGVRQLGLDALPWERDTRSLQARMEFVRALKRSDTADWPANDDAALLARLEDWLAPWLDGCTRRDHLSRVNLADALLARLTHAQRQQLNTLAPREQRVPSGSNIRINYEDGTDPFIAVRLHEVFGLAETPRIGGGAVPITFKLLSPAQRPVQITRDLAGFWRSSYVEVRKDMRGQYPRHNWPENPLEAAPTTRSIKRPKPRPG